METNSYIYYLSSENNRVQNIPSNFTLLPLSAHSPVHGSLLASFPSPQALPLHPHPTLPQPQIPGSSLTELLVVPIAS